MKQSDNEFDSIWDALEDTPAEAENMKARASLMMALRNHIAGKNLTQAEAAKLLGVTQPRISDLQRGKVDLFSIDKLINMLAMAGLHIEMTVAEAA